MFRNKEVGNGERWFSFRWLTIIGHALLHTTFKVKTQVSKSEKFIKFAHTLHQLKVQPGKVATKLQCIIT